MSNFFENFQTVNYNGIKSKNILQRIQIAREILQKIATFYPYLIQDGERADQIASDYYGSSEYIWLVYLSNDIIDPQYQWPLSDRQLYSRIADLYGSLEQAQSKILFYKSDSYTHTITPTTYKYLDIDEKTLWQPVYAFDYETDLNDSKKSIKLVSRKLLTTIESELATIFKGNVI